MSASGIVNGKLVGIAQVLLNQMKAEGRVVELTAAETARIDDELAKKLVPIRKDYERKSRMSLAYLASKGM